MPGLKRARVREIVERLAHEHADATIALTFRSPLELLVSVMLSAQTTDVNVNRVTATLFEKYHRPEDYLAVPQEELEQDIYPTGFFRQKAKSLIGMATALVADHKGTVPANMDLLVTLPGVGRKTANVVLGHALGVPGLPVDRHVLRVSNRIGIAEGDDPEQVEAQLCGALPPALWTLASDVQILHGRRTCRPKPLCEQCSVSSECDYYQTATAEPVRKKAAHDPRALRTSRR